MVQFNAKKREISLKVVYYGPPLSGKTTNLQALFSVAGPGSRGRLVTLETRDDRTIYFDMLPVMLSSKSGYRLSFKIYTVPGQAMHNATRRVVLRGVDAVAFVATSERDQVEQNTDSWRNLRENLALNNIKIEETPLVIQFNKQDLPNTFEPEELEGVALYSGVPCYPASALLGEGCYETLSGLLGLLWRRLCEKQSLDKRLDLSTEEFETHVGRVFGRDPGGYGPVRI
jgi:signal recognition particle receptor subunit beta